MSALLVDEYPEQATCIRVTCIDPDCDLPDGVVYDGPSVRKGKRAGRGHVLDAGHDVHFEVIREGFLRCLEMPA